MTICKKFNSHQSMINRTESLANNIKMLLLPGSTTRRSTQQSTNRLNASQDLIVTLWPPGTYHWSPARRKDKDGDWSVPSPKWLAEVLLIAPLASETKIGPSMASTMRSHVQGAIRSPGWLHIEVADTATSKRRGCSRTTAHKVIPYTFFSPRK